jgi:DNA-binding CsgD family transcriptional regulator
MQLFGLSKAEARVAAGVAEGRRLPEIAQASDVRMPTVRTQLRAALRKLGVARQADLVRVVLTLPAALSLRPGNDRVRDAG